MPDTIKPPVLLSRLLGFVCAAAVVMLGVLGFTLWRMFPLNRPQVFFLTTELRPDMDVRLYAMPTKSDEAHVAQYKEFFIKEYIKARNEISTNPNVMQRKWASDGTGVVSAWSDADVYADFQQTRLYNIMMRDGATINMTCTVEFPQGRLAPRKNGTTYAVPFSHICTNNNGHATRKDYTIVVSIEEMGKDDTMKWGDRINNPLGVRVVGYEIESGSGDPLDM